MAEQTTILAHRYAEMNLECLRFEEKLKAHKEEMKAIETQLKERFMAEGVSSIKTRLGLVHLHRQIRARCTDPTGLAVTEWGFLVNESVNSNSLSAAVRELELDQEGKPNLPEEVKDYIEVSEVWSVRVRQANGHQNA